MSELLPQPAADEGGQVLRGRQLPAILAVAGGNVAVLLLALVSGSVAARVLGPSLRGEFVATQTWASTASDLLTLGVTQAVVTYRGKDDEMAGPLVLQAMLTVPAGLGLFFLLAATGAQQWLTAPGVLGGAALTVGGLVISLCGGLVQRHGRMIGAFQRVRILPQAVTVAVLLLLWGSGNRDPNVWLLWLGLALSATALLLFSGLLRGRPGHIRLGFPPAALVRAALNAFAVVVGVSVIYRVDILVVAVYLDPAQVALYAVAVTAATVCNAVGQSVGMVAFSRLRHIESAAERRTVIRQGTIRALAATTVVAVPLAIVAPTAIRVVYGSAFVPATDATRILVIAAIPLSVDFLLLLTLLSVSAGWSAVRVQILDAILTVALLAIAIPTHNLVDIALVSLTVYTISAILLFVAALNRTRPGHADSGPTGPAAL